MNSVKLLLSFFLLSCGIPHELHGDVTFTESEREQIELANLYIARHVGEEPFHISWDAPHLTDTGNCTTHETINKRHLNPTNWYRNKYNCIDIDQSITPFMGAAAHEFGHMWGLKHLPSGVHGLMESSGATDMIWTENDQAFCMIQEVCR